MADLDDAAESGQGLLIDLFVGQEFRIIEKVPQEPTQLPHCFRRAIKAADDRLSGKSSGFNNRKPENVERLGGVPAKLGAVDPGEENTVGDLRDANRERFRRDLGLGVSCDHLLLRARIAVELAEQGIAIFLGPIGQFLDEVLNLLAGGFSKGLGATVVDGVCLDQFGIELVLTNDLAETVTNLRPRTIAISVRIL